MQDKINAANNSIKIKLKLNCYGLVLHHYTFKDLQNEKNKTLSKDLLTKKSQAVLPVRVHKARVKVSCHASSCASFIMIQGC